MLLNRPRLRRVLLLPLSAVASQVGVPCVGVSTASTAL